VRDPRGTLFQEIVHILRRSSPQFFILENVKRLLSMEGGDHFATILLALTEMEYFIEWRLLNAQYFGLPQNRQRIVIVGTRVGNFSKAEIKLATHRDLENVIRHNIDNLSLHSSWTQIEKHRKKFPIWGLAYKGRCYTCDLENFFDAQPIAKLESILQEKPDEYFFMDDTTNERLQISTFINRMVDGVRILYNQNGGARMGYTVFGTDGVAPALTASHSRHYERYKVGNRFRRLTNIEYALLQGFPDDHCSITSIFNQYGLYGNSVPPPLAEWAIGMAIKNGLNISRIKPLSGGQLSLFVE
jgi:DNA (cytosine-5)-methyltransferase 1